MVEEILSIIFGGGLIGLGLYNLIIWKLIKSNSVVIKAKLVGKAPVGRSRLYGIRGRVIEYTINNREYRTTLVVTKKAPLYNRNYWK